METKGRFIKKGFEQADEKRPFKAHGYMDVVKFDEESSIGRVVFEPGWNWEADVKPLAGTDSCKEEHSGYVLKGTLTGKLDTGEEFTLKAGDAYYLPAGHSGRVVGDENFEALDFVGAKTYAIDTKKKAA